MLTPFLTQMLVVSMSCTFVSDVSISWSRDIHRHVLRPLASEVAGFSDRQYGVGMLGGLLMRKLFFTTDSPFARTS